MGWPGYEVSLPNDYVEFMTTSFPRRSTEIWFGYIAELLPQPPTSTLTTHDRATAVVHKVITHVIYTS